MYSHESRKAAGGATSKIEEEEDTENKLKVQKAVPKKEGKPEKKE